MSLFTRPLMRMERYDLLLTPNILFSCTVNKQLNDKERVAAALENPALVEVLEQCLAGATV